VPTENLIRVMALGIVAQAEPMRWRLACRAHEDVTYAPTMFVSKLLATHLADEGVERCGFYKLDSGWGGVGGS